ncbi:uncharacterized protein KRP23_14906 [Phytophthora ramorum]|uniref:uncharacterized protein n=1 Tax=Phytophthora ramorum TaxID=164328 RepID=UPI0030B202E9|nr:hypothetical protein KRP23_14906 [Phytophthora ramorum]
MVSSSFVVLAMAASVLAAQTEAHSYMTDPMPTWSVGYPTTNYAGLIDGQDYLPCPDGMSYGGTPEGNTDAYWTAFNASKYTSLKNLADKTMVLQSLNPFGKATAECGFSLPNDVCAGASMMQSYWIALHGLPWQLYLNCVPLTGKLNSTANNVAGDSDSAKTPTATTSTVTEVPTSVTEAPTTSTTTTDAPETTTTDAPEATTPEVTPETPAPTPATPTATEPTTQNDEVSTGAKCSRRRK